MKTSEIHVLNNQNRIVVRSGMHPSLVMQSRVVVSSALQLLYLSLSLSINTHSLSQHHPCLTRLRDSAVYMGLKPLPLHYSTYAPSPVSCPALSQPVQT